MIFIKFKLFPDLFSRSSFKGSSVAKGKDPFGVSVEVWFTNSEITSANEIAKP